MMKVEISPTNPLLLKTITTQKEVNLIKETMMLQ